MLPVSGPVYIDANVVIYTVERIQPYISTLDMFWQDVKVRGLGVVTSELSVLEVLVRPIKVGDSVLEGLFRQLLLSSPDLRTIPVTLPVLERAAQLRAAHPGLKRPDAIHAATALEANCGLVLTNDPMFRQVTALNVALLSQINLP